MPVFGGNDVSIARGALMNDKLRPSVTHKGCETRGHDEWRRKRRKLYAQCLVRLITLPFVALLLSPAVIVLAVITIPVVLIGIYFVIPYYLYRGLVTGDRRASKSPKGG